MIAKITGIRVFWLSTRLVNANWYWIIAFHNNPSGDPEPSAWDMAITRRLKDVGEFLNIRLVDHIIVGEGSYFSLKEEKLM